MRQFTKEEALKLHESKVWEEWSDEKLFTAQLYQNKLFVPFGRFHEAAEKVLGRPVFTHEFAFPEQMKAELEGRREKPTFEEILNLIPEDKRVIVVEGQSAKDALKKKDWL